MNRVNGLAIMSAGLLLMMPLGFIPFSNTLPGVAILLFSAGMIQRDGATVLGGYLFLSLTVVYFAALAYAAVWAGQGAQQLAFWRLRAWLVLWDALSS